MARKEGPIPGEHRLISGSTPPDTGLRPMAPADDAPNPHDPPDLQPVASPGRSTTSPASTATIAAVMLEASRS